MIPVTYGNHLRNQPRQSTRKIARVGFLSSRLVGFLLLAVLALLYIAQSTQGATKQVEVQSLRSKAEQLVNEQNQLELEALRLKSLDTINQSAQEMGLEPVTSVEILPE